MGKHIDRIPLEDSESRREELANGIIHGIGAVLFLTAGIALIVRAVGSRSVLGILAYGVFALSATNLYVASALYHLWPRSQLKRALRLVDHVSIYLLIAGTYTPLTIAEIGGAWGWGLFAAEWTMAAAGIAFSWLRLGRMKIIPVLFYLLMGWLAVVAWTPISDAVPPAFMRWLIAGGLCYTVGIGAYAAKQVPFAHALWHLFVVGGTGCHIAGMYFTLL